MKKISAWMMGMMIVLSLCACSHRFGAEAKLKAAVNDDAYVYCLASYSNVKDVHTDIATIEVKDNVYTVYGTVIVNDVYNEQYEGRLTAKYLLNTDNRFVKISFYLEMPQ